MVASDLPTDTFLETWVNDVPVGCTAIEPIEDRPGWLRIVVVGRTVLLATETIVGIERDRPAIPGGPGRTWIQRRDGTQHFIGDVEPDLVLQAMDRADGEGPGDLPPPAPPGRDLLARILERRAAQAAVFGVASRDVEIPLPLWMLRDHALHLAQTVSHPRDWMLLVRDAAMEAAAALTEQCPDAADRFAALGRQVERDARRLPPEGRA